MNLHANQTVFAAMLSETATYMGMEDAAIMEKDYFATLFLKRISELQPGIIFKGGTSLSKRHIFVYKAKFDCGDRRLHQGVPNRYDDCRQLCLRFHEGERR
jgi:hypothetical protein